MDFLVNEEKVGCIIQARMGSTRLPGKVLKKLQDKTVLGHIIARLKKSNNIDVIIVATSQEDCDIPIKEECKKYGVECFCGELNDVLSRYYQAAKKYNLASIVRICADNTLVDWTIIDRQIELYVQSSPDILKSGSNIPLGIGGEIFSMEKLKEAYDNAKKEYQREHVTPYIYEKSKNIICYQIESDLSKYRFTLDTEEDWALIQKIYEYLYDCDNIFGFAAVINLMKEYPYLYEINKNVEQVKVLQLDNNNCYVKN